MYNQLREHKQCIQVTAQADTIQRVVEEHTEVFQPNRRGASAGLPAAGGAYGASPSRKHMSALVDQAQIIYATSKLVHNRSVIPKLLNEPPAIASFDAYKSQV